MSDMVQQKDIGALVTTRLASPFAAVAAGGAGNGGPVSGAAVQRSTIGMPRSAALLLLFSATLGAGRTLSLGAVQIQDSADGVTFTPFQTFVDPGVVLTGPSGGGSASGQLQLKGLFPGARDYVRVVFTPTLSAPSADTATVVAALVLAGSSRLPATA